ncbi:MAG: TetR family transcriptional regulator [Paraclostridium bifermentans]
MQHKNDLRIIKTNNNIRNTFVQLLNEKDFNSITVKDILDRALINRSTFYKYYTDKYNLAEVITQVFLDKFRSLEVL